MYVVWSIVFSQRKAEIDSGDDAIRNLITVLDNRKAAAIATTFKQAQTYFAEIFSELVPGGKAQLILTRREVTKEASESESDASESEQDSDDDDDDESSEPASKKGGKRTKAAASKKQTKKAKKTKKAAVKKGKGTLPPSTIDDYAGLAIKVMCLFGV